VCVCVCVCGCGCVRETFPSPSPPPLPPPFRKKACHICYEDSLSLYRFKVIALPYSAEFRGFVGDLAKSAELGGGGTHLFDTRFTSEYVLVSGMFASSGI
jgi:hypothetical protein